jgi:hypothetical protein
MKNRHRVSQVVSKAYLLMGVRRKILKQGAADRGEYRQAARSCGCADCRRLTFDKLLWARGLP